MYGNSNNGNNMGSKKAGGKRSRKIKVKEVAGIRRSRKRHLQTTLQNMGVQLTENGTPVATKNQAKFQILNNLEQLQLNGMVNLGDTQSLSQQAKALLSAINIENADDFTINMTAKQMKKFSIVNQADNLSADGTNYFEITDEDLNVYGELLDNQYSDDNSIDNGAPPVGAVNEDDGFGDWSQFPVGTDNTVVNENTEKPVLKNTPIGSPLNPFFEQDPNLDNSSVQRLRLRRKKKKRGNNSNENQVNVDVAFTVSHETCGILNKLSNKDAIGGKIVVDVLDAGIGGTSL